jgi:two-component system, cell cycle response regulator DivK
MVNYSYNMGRSVAVKTLPKLLVVEDDIENQKLLKILLRQEFCIDFCDSADSFYPKIKTEDYDLILMDISLIGSKDGLVLTEELKADNKFKHIPIVALTAHAYQKDKINAYNSGVDLFLTKPIQGNHLLESLMKVLEQKVKSVLE